MDAVFLARWGAYGVRWIRATGRFVRRFAATDWRRAVREERNLAATRLAFPYLRGRPYSSEWAWRGTLGFTPRVWSEGPR